ncbi:unnamed protein product [Lactuca virosa]|uniref:Uncharacterized protein n=1 Tax=Lactuca virosa TaxID=75947 RepID=A0AAU9MMZ9_9ASTR|nr:unnamed protein product [Lactuca virosa]
MGPQGGLIELGGGYDGVVCRLLVCLNVSSSGKHSATSPFIHTARNEDGEMATPETSREPCPDRILDDIGGAFGMGAVGGAAFHFLKGTYNSPKNERLIGGSQAVRMNAPSRWRQFRRLGRPVLHFRLHDGLPPPERRSLELHHRRSRHRRLPTNAPGTRCRLPVGRLWRGFACDD